MHTQVSYIYPTTLPLPPSCTSLTGSYCPTQRLPRLALKLVLSCVRYVFSLPAFRLLIIGVCDIDNLVADHKELCKFAFERGSLDRLGALVKSITPSEKTVEWEEDEPESISCLREVNVISIFAYRMLSFCSKSLYLRNDLGCTYYDRRNIPL